jgi:dihydroorotase
MGRLILENGRLLDPSRDLDTPGSVVIDDGRIHAVVPASDGPIDAEPGDERVDVEGAWISPGFLDLRASLREPGFEQKEDIHTGLRAAAAGGFTAICALPDTHPVMDRPAVILQVLERAASAQGARLLPVAAATRGLGDEHLAPIGELAEAGCVAVTQGEKPIGSPRLMRRVLEYCGGFELPVISSPVDPGFPGLCDEGIWSTRLGLPSTPTAAEIMAVARDLSLAELTGQRLHLSRISTAGSLELIARAKEQGVRVTCDVTAHHLALTTAALADYDPNTRVWPPLRSEADVAALRGALRSGLVDAVVSDHQPHHREDKEHEFTMAASGISSLETVVPLLLERVSSGDLSPLEMARLLCLGPMSCLGLEPQGLIEGHTADLSIVDPNRSWTLTADAMISRGKNSPFLNKTFQGRSTLTVIAGQVLYRAPASKEMS